MIEEGQITIDGYLQEKWQALEQKYPIPKDEKYRSEEGWYDDWHYCEMEKPAEVDVYFGILISDGSEHYYYEYIAWAKDKWWFWDSWFHKWKDMPHFYTPLAWVKIPTLYLQKDAGLKEKLGLRGII